jgi:hypothetical protein
MRILIGLLACCGLASPQTAPARVEGQLVDAASGDGIRKGWLTLRGVLANSTGYTAVSDSNGNFVFDAIAPGRYSLSAEHASYLRSAPATRQLTVAPGETVKAGRIAMTAQSVISGRVLDEDGDPLPSGMQVQVSRWRWDPLTGQRTLAQVKQTGADDQGNFRLAGLAAGRYYLSGYGGRTTAAFDDRTVMPRSEAYTTTYYPGVSEPGRATPVPLAAGSEIRDLNLRLRKAPVARIRGAARDTSTGEPANQVVLQLVPIGAFPTSPLTNDAVAVVQNGSFEFPRVPAGNYAILASDTTRAGRPVGRYNLNVADSDIDGILVSLSPGMNVECRFKMESNDPVPTGLQLVLRSADGARINVAANPDAKDSVLRATGLLPGRYWVDITSRQSNAYVKAIRFGDFDATYKPIDVLSGAQPALEVVLSANGGSVGGTARNAKGDAFPAPQVILAPTSPELGEVTRLVKSSPASPQGGFRFSGVAPGEYILLAFEDIEAGPPRDPAFRAALLDKGVKVTVQESSSLTLDVPLIPSAVTAAELAKLQ